MKKLLFLTLILGASISANAQFYFGLGYNINFPSVDSINYIINRYNETRDWLDDDMDQIKFAHGFSLGTGFINRGVLVEMSWVGRHAHASASGTQPADGTRAQRDIRYRMNTFNIGVGGAFVNEGNIQLGIGGSLDFGNLRLSTRVGDPDEVKGMDYEDAVKDLVISSSLFLHLMFGELDETGIGIIARPYYQLPWLTTNVVSLNNRINSATSGNDPFNINERPTSFGVRILLVLHGERL